MLKYEIIYVDIYEFIYHVVEILYIECHYLSFVVIA